jgi:hypothetical protein
MKQIRKGLGATTTPSSEGEKLQEKEEQAKTQTTPRKIWQADSPDTTRAIILQNTPLSRLGADLPSSTEVSPEQKTEVSLEQKREEEKRQKKLRKIIKETVAKSQRKSAIQSIIASSPKLSPIPDSSPKLSPIPFKWLSETPEKKQDISSIPLTPGGNPVMPTLAEMAKTPALSFKEKAQIAKLKLDESVERQKKFEEELTEKEKLIEEGENTSLKIAVVQLKDKLKGYLGSEPLIEFEIK